MAENDLVKHTLIRKAVQSIWGILHNAHFQGFLTGTIYEGPLKKFCVPGMNCYSCPGAVGACPIGSMQALFDGRKRKFSFYVVGYLALIGLLVGRFICGWMCLFGLIQELLYKIPTPKLKISGKADKVLRFIKYVMLLVFVFGLPFFYRGDVNVGLPFFCKFICPVGTLEGGIPLVLLNKGMRAAAGALFGWKFFLLILCILTSIFIYRPFCKYICPLGAFYSLFQKVSILRLSLDKDRCVSCGACARQCKMGVNPASIPNSTECIRCGECVKVCPKNALSWKAAGSVKKPVTVRIPQQEI